DGELSQRLNARFAKALQEAGGDVQQAERRIFGRRTLIDAPGLDHAILRNFGFTDIELAAVEQALAQADSFDAVFTAPVLDPGFIRDVLGLEDGDGPLLHLLGVSEEAEAAAATWVFGHGDLAGWEDAPEHLADLFANPAAVEADLKSAAEVFSDIPAVMEIEIGWRQSASQAVRFLSQAAVEGRR
ncbi:hypothetical protein LTR94_030731, partial [Friedmanniomyces endolithicus]